MTHHTKLYVIASYAKDSCGFDKPYKHHLTKPHVAVKMFVVIILHV